MKIFDPIQDFARLVQRAEEEFNLDEAALLIARTEYPDLIVADQLGRLDALAFRLHGDLSRPAIENIQSMNKFLFKEEQFRGNEEEYDDPRNSYLNDVLDRKAWHSHLPVAHLHRSGQAARSARDGRELSRTFPGEIPDRPR